MKKFTHLKYKNDQMYWKLLLKNRHNLQTKVRSNSRYVSFADEHKLVHDMLHDFPDLECAYTLFNDYKDFNYTSSIDEAKANIDMFIERFLSSPYIEFKEIGKMLRNWKLEIINSFSTINNYYLVIEHSKEKTEILRLFLEIVLD